MEREAPVKAPLFLCSHCRIMGAMGVMGNPGELQVDTNLAVLPGFPLLPSPISH